VPLDPVDGKKSKIAKVEVNSIHYSFSCKHYGLEGMNETSTYLGDHLVRKRG